MSVHTARKIRNAIVFVATTSVATVGLYGVLDFSADQLHADPTVLPIAHHKPLPHDDGDIHRQCWVEAPTAKSAPQVLCASSTPWDSYTAKCIEDAVADHVDENYHDITNTCEHEADRYAPQGGTV